MPRRYIDLSMTLENDVISDPPFLAPRIEYDVHADTRHELETFRALISGTCGQRSSASTRVDPAPGASCIN